MALVNGVHVLIYTSNPEADRMFFRDVLGFQFVDVGGGWLIFALPPAEAAFHPVGDTEEPRPGHQLLGSAVYLMCDDLRATIASLASRDIRCTDVEEERWGIRTTIRLPSGGEVGLYQPTHETALNL